MKKLLFTAFLSGAILFQSCATIFGGEVSDCQRTKPAPGQPSREIRVVPLVLDIFCGLIWVAVDFATGAIYKPCNTQKPQSNDVKTSNQMLKYHNSIGLAGNKLKTRTVNQPS